MFPRMLMKLVSLRTLSSVHSEQVFALRLQDKKLPPLLSEIWDVNEWLFREAVDWRGSEQEDGRCPRIGRGVFFFSLCGGRRTAAPLALKQTDTASAWRCFFPLGADTTIKSQNIFPFTNISIEPYPHFWSDCC